MPPSLLRTFRTRYWPPYPGSLSQRSNHNVMTLRDQPFFINAALFFLAIAATRVGVHAAFDGGVSLAALRDVGELIGWMYLIVCAGFYALKLSLKLYFRS